MFVNPLTWEYQLQLNSVNLQTLLDAGNTRKHRNLIVRVWGWSRYFVELAGNTRIYNQAPSYDVVQNDDIVQNRFLLVGAFRR